MPHHGIPRLVSAVNKLETGHGYQSAFFELVSANLRHQAFRRGACLESLLTHRRVNVRKNYLMVTAKKSTPAKTVTAKKAVAAKKSSGAALKPITSAFNKTSLLAHLAQTTGVEAKQVKAVLAGLEATMLASLHKKGLGEFTLPGLLKVTAVAVPAKKKRVGINPFTKQEQTFAAKPATTKLRLRALKKVKDAAL